MVRIGAGAGGDSTSVSLVMLLSTTVKDFLEIRNTILGCSVASWLLLLLDVSGVTEGDADITGVAGVVGTGSGYTKVGSTGAGGGSVNGDGTSGVGVSIDGAALNDEEFPAAGSISIDDTLSSSL